MSSKRAIRRRQCGKTAYPDKETAGRAIGHAWRVGGHKLSIYVCRWCGQYHIGHTPKAERHRRAAQRANARRFA